MPSQTDRASAGLTAGSSHLRRQDHLHGDRLGGVRGQRGAAPRIIHANYLRAAVEATGTLSAIAAKKKRLTPQQTGAVEVVQRARWMTSKQGQRIPAEVGGTLSPAAAAMYEL